SSEDKADLQKTIRSADSDSSSPTLASAVQGQGLNELLQRIDEALPVDPIMKLSLRLPLSNGRALALVHALGRVVHSEVDDSDMLPDAEVPESLVRRLKLQDFTIHGTSVSRLASD